jgi:hypothetical protein
MVGKASCKTLQAEFKDLIFVRYVDHVVYSRASAMAMKPQIREAVGWLVYECSDYLTLIWDRDAEPPTLRGGDPKASGLVLLKSDILELKKMDLPSIMKNGNSLNLSATLGDNEYAPETSGRKTQRRANKR